MKCPLFAWSGCRVAQPTMSFEPTQVVKTLAILGGRFLQQQYLFHNEFRNVVCTHYGEYCCHIKQNFPSLRRIKMRRQNVVNALQGSRMREAGSQKTLPTERERLRPDIFRARGKSMEIFAIGQIGRSQAGSVMRKAMR